MIRVSKRQEVFPSRNECGRVLGVGVFVEAFAPGVRLMVNQNGRRALQYAPAFLQYAQTQVDVAKPHAQ